MIILCPNSETLKFLYNPEIEFDAYNESRENAGLGNI